VNEVLRLRGEYFGKIEVMLGLEMDFLDGLENYCRDLIARYPWDYIIGSVHYLDTACRLGAWPKNCGGDIGAHYKRYFEQLRKLARSGICDIIAHFDIPRRTGQDPTAANAADIADTLREIANAGLSLEINTSGYRHAELPHPAPYPNFPIIKEAIALGIPMTVNSDSHDPQHVGWKFAEIELFLRRNSCEQLARYERRKRVMYDL
jgi:histidinol-phosphatase (PHP family)